VNAVISRTEKSFHCVRLVSRYKMLAGCSSWADNATDAAVKQKMASSACAWPCLSTEL